MKTKTYKIDHSDMSFEYIVEECTRKEFVELAVWAIEGIEMGDEDTSVYVLYKDGREFISSLEGGTEGKFLKTNIKCGIIVNAATQQVTGKYEVDGDGNVQPECENQVQVDIEIDFCTGIDEYGQRTSSGWGYVIWNADYTVKLAKSHGYESYDAADKAAERYLNREYGRNGWCC